METLKCTICDWTTTDILNKGGQPRKHLKFVHDIIGEKYDYKNHFIKYELPDKPVFTCPLCDWTTVDLDNKSGWFTTHLKKIHGMEPWDFYEKHPEYKRLWIEAAKDKDRLDHIAENSDNYLTCQECGDKLIRITPSHLKLHGITMREYRRKHNVLNTMSVSLCKKFSNNYYDNPNLQNLHYQSKAETEIKQYLDELNVAYISPYRKGSDPAQHALSRFEIDIYLPDYKIGIEYNGLYYHSDFNMERDKSYHLNKTTLSENRGDKLIHIFEDEWNDKSDIVKSRLAGMVGKSKYTIYGRQCDIQPISKEDKAIFLESNHLQGNDNSSVYIGLFYKMKLISVMTFSAPRLVLGNKTSKNGEYELVRFCTELSTNVIGGASKLLKYFEDNYHPIQIITYADRRYTSSVGDTLYDKIGFSFIEDTRPNYWYMYKYKKREHRFKYTKHRILEKFPTADPNLSEWENMKLLGYDRIWDCGSKKYIKTFN